MGPHCLGLLNPFWPLPNHPTTRAFKGRANPETHPVVCCTGDEPGTWTYVLDLGHFPLHRNPYPTGPTPWLSHPSSRDCARVPLTFLATTTATGIGTCKNTTGQVEGATFPFSEGSSTPSYDRDTQPSHFAAAVSAHPPTPRRQLRAKPENKRKRKVSGGLVAPLDYPNFAIDKRSYADRPHPLTTIFCYSAILTPCEFDIATTRVAVLVFA